MPTVLTRHCSFLCTFSIILVIIIISIIITIITIIINIIIIIITIIIIIILYFYMLSSILVWLHYNYHSQYVYYYYPNLYYYNCNYHCWYYYYTINNLYVIICFTSIHQSTFYTIKGKKTVYYFRNKLHIPLNNLSTTFQRTRCFINITLKDRVS